MFWYHFFIFHVCLGVPYVFYKFIYLPIKIKNKIKKSF
jgi:hypothetical protein